MTRHLSVLALLLWAVTGCAKPTARACTPGETRACPACPVPGASGTQSCAANATWDGCLCGAPAGGGNPPDAGPADAGGTDAGPGAANCRPTNCRREHKNCSSIPDGCGRVLDCGACPVPQTCSLTAANVCGPVPSPLATGRNHPWTMVSDGTSLFWIDYGSYTPLYPTSQTLPANGSNASVLAMSRGGGAVTVLASGLANARGIAVDAAKVYFTTAGNPGPAPGSVWSVPKGGGQAATALATGQGGPAGIAVDDTSVWWVNFNSTVSGQLMRVPKGGGTPAVVTTILGTDLTLDADNVYWTSVPYPSVQSAAIFQLSKLGGAPKAVVQGLLNPGPLLIDAGKIYWVDDGNLNTIGRLMSYDLARQMKTELAVNLNNPRSLGLDANYFYWTEFGDLRANTNTGKVMALPRAGGTALNLAVGLNHPSFLVLDGTGLFFTLHGQLSVNTDRGQVLALPRFW